MKIYNENGRNQFQQDWIEFNINDFVTNPFAMKAKKKKGKKGGGKILLAISLLVTFNYVNEKQSGQNQPFN